MKNQNGFAALEGILILVIVAIIGGTGWYVLHSKSQANKVLDEAAKTSQSSAPKVSKKYVTIKEWGVRAPLSGGLTVEYAIMPGSPASASFSSSQLDASDQNCKVDLSKKAGGGGTVNRYRSTDDVILSDGTDSGMTAADYAKQFKPSNYKQVGDYYYFYNNPQAMCGSSNASNTIQIETNTAVKNIVANLQATK